MTKAWSDESSEITKASSEGAVPLKPGDEKKAEQEKDLDAHITYEVVRREGCDELERSSSALAWSGFAAGLSMGFSFFTEAVLKSHLPEAKWAPLITTFGYPIGFLLVILGSQQLFTENTLTAVIPLLAEKTRKVFNDTMRLWIVVLLANLAGAFVFALVMSIHGLFSEELVNAFALIARDAIKANAMQTFGLAIFAGFLIAMMVWMLPAAGELDAVVIIIVTYVVGIASFPHVIAGAIEAFYAGLHGITPWHVVISSFLLPALIGNTIGGTMLVAGLAHAQVASGGDNK